MVSVRYVLSRSRGKRLPPHMLLEFFNHAKGIMDHDRLLTFEMFGFIRISDLKKDKQLWIHTDYVGVVEWTPGNEPKTITKLA